MKRFSAQIVHLVLIFSLLPFTQPAFSQNIEENVQPATLSPAESWSQESAVVETSFTPVMPQARISYEPVPLNSKYLKKHYAGYRITLTNPGPENLIIETAQINNAVDSQTAYKRSHKKLIGITSFLGATGFVSTAVLRKNRNNRAKKEAKRFSDNRLITVLPAGQSETLMTMVPKGSPPDYVITLKDEATGQTYTLNASAPTEAGQSAPNP